MSRAKKKIISYLLFFIIALFCGCNGKTVNQEREIIKEKREITEVLDKKWIDPSSETENIDGWEVTQYVPDIVKPSNESLMEKGTFVSSNLEYLFALIHYEQNMGDDIIYGYEWKTINLQTMERHVKSELFTEPDFEGVLDSGLAEDISKKINQGYARVTSFEACGTTINVFLTVWNETWEIQHFYLFHMSREGNVEWAGDYVNNVWPDGNDRLGQFNIPDAFYGKAGVIYSIDQNNRTIKAFDENGGSTMSFDINDKGRAPILYAGKTQNDIPIFYAELVRGEKEFFYVEDDRLHTIWKGTIEASKCRLDQYGNMLLMQGDRLMTWNVVSGELHCLYQFTGLSAYSCNELARNANGEIILYYGQKGENGFIYRLNDSEHPNVKELILLQSFSDDYTAKCAADYTRTHPDIRIRVEQMEDHDEMAWQRLAATISNGQGPDIILANREQLSMLKDANIICSITDQIQDSEKDKVFFGALKYGMFENEIYAMPHDASVGIWMIRKDLIPEASWNLEGIMDAFEKWKENNQKARRVECIPYNATSAQLLYDLCVQNLENCEFVDLDNHKCNFETKTFYRLLKFCLEYGENQETTDYLSREEQWEQMLEGEAFLFYAGGSLKTYSANRKALGDQFCTIGYPSKNGTTSLIHCYRAVAVNEMSLNKAVAIDFLLCLVNEENQVNYTTEWVNRDVLREHVKDQSGNKEGPYFQINRYKYMPLDGRDDGTSYLDEYMQLMDQGEPLSVQYYIRDMVMEEAMAYFAGDKTEKEVAKIIQNRVQNYLNEQ